MIVWHERSDPVPSSERVTKSAHHGIGDLYPLWETEPREPCYWKGCLALALPISFEEGRWVRLCPVHSGAVHAAHGEGLRIDVHWQGDIHPVLWITP